MTEEPCSAYGLLLLSSDAISFAHSSVPRLICVSVCADSRLAIPVSPADTFTVKSSRLPHRGLALLPSHGWSRVACSTRASMYL